MCQATQIFTVRLQESYKRFVKTWICKDLESRIPTPKRSTNLNPYCFEKIRFMDLIRDQESSHFSKTQPVFTNPTNPYNSLVQWHKTIKIPKSLQFQTGRSANPDLQIQASNYPFRGFLWGKKVKMFCFILICTDWCTNHATLIYSDNDL